MSFYGQTSICQADGAVDRFDQPLRTAANIIPHSDRVATAAAVLTTAAIKTVNPQRALTIALLGTSLGFRRTSDGAWTGALAGHAGGVARRRLLAVDLYDQPAQPRRLEGFYVDIHTPWLYLLHAGIRRVHGRCYTPS